jgi:hypothetical protein
MKEVFTAAEVGVEHYQADSVINGNTVATQKRLA